MRLPNARRFSRRGGGATLSPTHRGGFFSKRRLAILLLLLAAAGVPGAVAQAPPDLLTLQGSLRPGASPGEGALVVTVKLAPGWHVNSHTPSQDFLIGTAVSLDAAAGVSFEEPKYPKGETKKFAFSESALSVYEGRFTIEVPARWSGTRPPVLSGSLEYQACDDARCLPPTTARFSTGAPSGVAAVAELPGGAVPLSAAPAAGSTQAGASSDFGRNVEDEGYLLVLLSVFLGGLALNLTPCVYPVIPLTIGFFGGQAAGRRARLFSLATVYVLGIVVMYSALGVAAALSGQLFGSMLQNPWVLAGMALLLILLALAMFGVYEIRMPTSWMQKAGAKTGLAGSFGMGLFVGVVAAPCVAPFTLGLLAFVAERRSVALGILFFAVLSLGLGLPYLFLAIFSGNLSRLPRAGEWMEGVKKVFGWLLLAMAAYFGRLVLPSPWNAWLLPVTLAAGAVALSVRGFGFARVVRFGTAVLFLAAAVFFLPRKALGWQPYEEARIATAGRPAIIDFTADWCLPCLELDQRTFSDRRVRGALSKRAIYKADLTRGGSPEAVALTRKYRIVGVPTVIFLDAAGREREDLRLVGFEDAEKFLARLAKAP